MTPTDTGAPSVGVTARSLRVRPPESASPDIGLDADGSVLLDGRGMSVGAGWRDLPPARIPRRLDRFGDLGASGNDKDRVFTFGGTGFAEGASVAAQLRLRRKANPRLGNVAPSNACQLEQHQAALAATQPMWTVDEA